MRGKGLQFCDEKNRKWRVCANLVSDIAYSDANLREASLNVGGVMSAIPRRKKRYERGRCRCSLLQPAGTVPFKLMLHNFNGSLARVGLGCSLSSGC